ncbi:MAG: type II toxin-antitoxin system RelE/ParE family toxin [Desulfovibrionaceae bacterium]|jgi:plasmid stabilization system protein ParE|nr:type II toxin-antitoxin system RelE/ParE family toxin [Desulfovibrionaceae bacterium]
MPLYKVDWSQSAGEDVRELFDYLAENASLQDAQNVTERIMRSTDRLAEFPRLYEADPRFGEGVRRIAVAGRFVLYEVDDQAQIVRVLTVAGQRQKPQKYN